MNPNNPKQKAYFSSTFTKADGSTGKVLNYLNPTLAKCNVCSVSLTHLSILLSHINGKKHLYSIAKLRVKEGEEPPPKKTFKQAAQPTWGENQSSEPFPCTARKVEVAATSAVPPNTPAITGKEPQSTAAAAATEIPQKQTAPVVQQQQTGGTPGLVPVPNPSSATPTNTPKPAGLQPPPPVVPPVKTVPVTPSPQAKAAPQTPTLVVAAPANRTPSKPVTSQGPAPGNNQKPPGTPIPVVANRQPPKPIVPVTVQLTPQRSQGAAAIKKPLPVQSEAAVKTVSPAHPQKLPETVVKLLDIQRELYKNDPPPTPIQTIPLNLPVRSPAAAPQTQRRVNNQKQRMSTGPELFLNLEKHTEPLIGLEYLVELHQYDTEPRYHCVLCDKMGDPRTIIIHITSTAHRMKYFDKHYPSMMKELGELRYDKEARVAVIKVLEEVASAVEKYHGRTTPVVLEDGHYKAERMRYLQQIINAKHFSEFVGPSFVQLVDKKKIANITRTVKLKADVQRTVAEVEAAQRVRIVEEDSESPRRRSFRSRSRSVSPRSRNKYGNDRRRRSRTPPRRSGADAEKLSKYSAMKATAVKEVESRYQEYELHPEKHPLYSAEWESFWNRRYKELQLEGKDASAYDFKPEWIAFWTRRLKELFNSDVDAAKRDIKIKLGLPPGGSPTRSNSIEGGGGGRERDRKRPSSVDKWSDDERDPIKRNRRDRSPSDSSRGRGSNRRSSRSPSRSTVHSKRRLSRSPSLDRRERIRELDRIISRLPGSSREYGRDYDRERGDRYDGYDYHFSGGSRDRYRGSSGAAAYDRDESSSSTGGIPVVVIDDEDDNEPVTVVSLLRILSALEEQLGSMGAKTLDMLAKALAMEKAKANSSDDLMMTDSNAVFFETIKEKLKGQMITGVLNKNKVNAVKKAIRKIAEILHEITKKTAEAEKAEKEAEASKRTIVIKVNMDKAMIAQRIALALVTEKKTDVTPEQLEILINVFFEMLRKSKELNKMVTTQDYIELLEEQKVQSVAEKVDILGIIGKRETSSPGLARKPEKPVVKMNYDDEPGEGQVPRGQMGGRRPEQEEEEDMFEEDDAFLKNAQIGDGFSDSDLQTLLMNFKDLSSDEQQHLIRHLKKLETEAPERVEKLRRFVNFDGIRRSSGGGGGGGGKLMSMSEELSKRRNRWGEAPNEGAGGGGESSSMAARLGPVPPPSASSHNAAAGGVGLGAAAAESGGEMEKVKFDMKKKEQTIQPLALLDDDDDDDDDYSYDDVVKAASKNLEKKSGATKGKEGERDRWGGGGGGEAEKKNGKGDLGAGSKAKERSVSPETKRISETHSLIANIMGSLQKAAGGGASSSTSTAAASTAASGGASKGDTIPLSLPSGSGGNKSVAGGGAGNKNAKAGPVASGANNAAASLPFYQQQNSSYKSTYQEQIAQQQQQQQYLQYQQQMQAHGGYDQQQQQMMYQQQQGNNGQGGQWWGGAQQQNPMYNNQQQQQQFYGNNNSNFGPGGGPGGPGGPQNQYPNNGGYGNFY